MFTFMGNRIVLGELGSPKRGFVVLDAQTGEELPAPKELSSVRDPRYVVGADGILAWVDPQDALWMWLEGWPEPRKLIEPAAGW